jgi:hypothetical protein
MPEPATTTLSPGTNVKGTPTLALEGTSTPPSALCGKMPKGMSMDKTSVPNTDSERSFENLVRLYRAPIFYI